VLDVKIGASARHTSEDEVKMSLDVFEWVPEWMESNEGWSFAEAIGMV